MKKAVLLFLFPGYPDPRLSGNPIISNQGYSKNADSMFWVDKMED
jgi:hypothetical protein